MFHDLWNHAGAWLADFKEFGPVIGQRPSAAPWKSLKFLEICKAEALPGLQISKNFGLVHAMHACSQVCDSHAR